LLLLQESLFKLSLDVLLVSSRLLQLNDHLSLLWVEHPQGRFFLLVESALFL
jgi:hypothetical protein